MVKPSAMQEARLEWICKLAPADFGRAQYELRRMNQGITDYVLEDIPPDSTYYAKALAVNPRAKRVRWLQFHLEVGGDGKINLMSAEHSTVWMYPGEDMYLNDTTMLRAGSGGASV